MINLKPHENSLFSILLRSPWWASLLIAVGLYFVSRLFLPPIAAAASTLPWVGLALYALWKQSKVPSASRVEEVLTRVRSMTWEGFSPLLADMFRREGYAVNGIKGVADFALVKQGYVTLASCRRWKIAQVGVAHVEELVRAVDAAQARDAILVAAGEVSAKAAALANEKGVKILSGVELAARLGRLPKVKS